jgi:hypothetical protein
MEAYETSQSLPESSIAVFKKCCDTFQPYLFQNMLSEDTRRKVPMQLLNPSDSFNETKEVEVSFANFDGNTFEGFPLKRNKTQMTLSHFSKVFHQQLTSIDADSTMKNIYLSQFCILSKDNKNIDLPISHSYLEESILPPLLSLPDIETVNLWANVSYASTTLHYDANHNLLCVFQGEKTIQLLSPLYTEELHAYSAYLETPNHSMFSPQQIFEFIEMKKSINNNYRNNNNSLSIEGIHEYTLCPGDVLLIPEGWWHQVQSKEMTFGINIWFPSSLQLYLQQQKHMHTYILRSCVHSLIEQSESKEINQLPINNMMLKKRGQKRVREDETIFVTDSSISDVDKMATVNDFMARHNDLTDILAGIVDDKAVIQFKDKFFTFLNSVMTEESKNFDFTPLMKEVVYLSFDKSRSTILFPLWEQIWIPLAQLYPQVVMENLGTLSDDVVVRLLKLWDDFVDIDELRADKLFKDFFQNLGDENSQQVYNNKINLYLRNTNILFYF